MNINDRRVRENHEKIRCAMCEIITSTHPENISIKSVAARAHLSYSTVYKHITSIPNAFRIFDEEILTEFQIRRAIQKSDPQIDDMAIGDFFMRLPRRSATIENI